MFVFVFKVISYLCLHPQCFGSKKLLCIKCIKENMHRNHQIILINKAIDPFSRLSMNSYQPNSRKIHKQLNTSIESIVKVLDKVVQQFCQQIEQLKSQLVDVMQTISDTYSTESVQQASLQCGRRFRYQNTSKFDVNINTIAEKIILLLKLQKNCYQGQTAKFNSISEKAVQVVTENSQAIIKMVNNMKSEFTKLKLTLIRHNESQNLVEKRTIKSKQAQKVSLMRRPLKKNLIDKKTYSASKPIFNFSSMSQNNQNLKQSNTESIQIGESQAMCVQLDLSMEDEQPKTKLQNGQKERQILVVKGQLGQLEYSKYQGIVIEEGVKINQLINILPLFTNLIQISIFDVNIAQQPTIVDLLSTIPQSVRQIYFNSSNQFNLECINTLTKRSFNSRITHLVYFYDVHKEMRRVDQSLYFRERHRGIRIEPLKFTQTYQILQKFPKITNIWIPLKDFTISGGRKMPYQQFQHLIIGQIEEEAHFPQRLPTHLISGLYKAHNLKTFTLLNVFLNDASFTKIIKQAVNLQCIYLEYCQGISEKSMEIIKEQSNLVNFSIKQCPLITGTFIQKLYKTKIFIMDYAEYSSRSEVIFKSFQGLRNLQYLNLYRNIHFVDKLLYDLSGCLALKSLNIGETSITNHSIDAFSKLKQLQCLCIDENKLTTEQILTILSFTPEINKLSICGYNGDNGKGLLTTTTLNTIGLSLPKLTHLSIRNCPGLNGDLNIDAFRSLKYVQIEPGGNSQLIERFMQGGVQVFQDQ